jgi:hypothetical protein
MELSINDLKQLIGTSQPQPTPHIFGDFIGKYCICRASSAGVHAGTIKAIGVNADGTKSVVLTNARRMWSWKAASGIALSGAAMAGIVRSASKIDTMIPEHGIDGVCEIIPCTTTAQESIHGA